MESIAPTWRSNPEALLNKQAALTFDLVESTLEANPPTKEQSLARKLALYNIDGLVHEKKYDQSDAFLGFMNTRIEGALEAMKIPVVDGMKIYKLYNHGFVLRTKSVSIAFDLYQGKNLVEDSLMQAIVDQSDILFVSHLHQDHADTKVAEMFIKAGKPVWAPTNVWEDNPSVNHIRSEEILDTEASLPGGTIKVKVLPGHQGDIMNNVYHVTTPEGYSMVHTGDQFNEEDLEWVSGIKEEIGQLDVLLVNCWTLRLDEFAAGFDPKLVVPGHENEMGHTVGHREPYWQSYLLMEDMNRPYVLMTWGEFYEYNR